VKKPLGPIALCAACRYIPCRAFSVPIESERRLYFFIWRLGRRSENNMRAEVERLVEEIKQSVGLLRRHL